ncbi:uncharacterized protein [Aegilops tauschii subsp. strangulata]|uniref:uncharacterized protein n=1 Tax=Aegilops tauschii subsp. strangulata TaxID=200361 RepID=UPI001ABC606D|nr:uncharacterized protein LOC109739656 [Aegilops tauschii subsp. strangulata]
MAQLPPELPDDVVEEILRRLPPDEPAHLARASLVSKPWCRLLCNPAFRRSYHRAPPMLGFFHNAGSYDHPVARFVRSKALCPRYPDISNFRVRDCRHGRVLLQARRSSLFVVWDPMTGSRREVRRPAGLVAYEYDVVVLCALGGACNHHACHEGPFLVVYVGIKVMTKAISACVYSSDTGKWSAQTSAYIFKKSLNCVVSTAIVGGALYFPCSDYGKNRHEIIKYDWSRHCLSVIDMPRWVNSGPSCCPLLAAPEDGRLGFAQLITYYGTQPRALLRMCSRDVNADGDGSIYAWTDRREIDLNALLPTGDRATKLYLHGSVEGTDIVFIVTNSCPFVLYEIDLKSLQTRKLYEGKGEGRITHNIFPFMSFYTPAAILASVGDTATVVRPVPRKSKRKRKHNLKVMGPDWLK